MTPFDERFSAYVPRTEESRINAQVALVRQSRRSRAVLVHGVGGVGKTSLIQAVAHGTGSDDVVRIQPIDIDDSEYWLLSNLESTIADAIDPARDHFGPYFEYMSQVPRYVGQTIGYETVVTHLGRINTTFVSCYEQFVHETGRTVVVTLDTVEAIRGMHLLLTLTQWMKRLPSTLFVLSGRPPSRLSSPDGDPLVRELTDPHDPLPLLQIGLTGFGEAETRRFVDGSEIGDALTAPQRDRLLALTEGLPLWLSLAVEYLQGADLPPEMLDASGDLDLARASFRRRLVAPYRSNDFWPEAIKRLAVIRHSVNQQVWQQLMEDRSLPDGCESWDDAWMQLLRRPWIRSRANRRFVTLHDALAEELARRLIPVHDLDRGWRRRLWHRAASVYRELTAGDELRIRDDLGLLNRRLSTATGVERDDLISAVARLDRRKRELDQLLTARLHYEILDDHDAGTLRFLELHQRSIEDRDPLFTELVSHEMESFLPRGEMGESLDDVFAIALLEFEAWLDTTAPQRHIEIGIRIATYLTHNEQAEPAMSLLARFPGETDAGPELRYQLANARGNACMRIAGRVEEARAHFDAALAEAHYFTNGDRALVEAEAHKELGFYYRNLGQWAKADAAYLTARNVLSRALGPGSPPEQREQMASIQTNWAYLKALRGHYREARNLVDSAIAVRRRFGRRHGEGVSLSVSGEVFRYSGKFISAWSEYEEAETIFHELKNWPWLGQLYQEQAICLYQAAREQIVVVKDDQDGLARALARQALDICRESAIRSYPSALNRSGRIVAASAPDEGIQLLAEGINAARRIGDGWFWSANLIEFLEVNYQEWRGTGNVLYRNSIQQRASEVEEAIRTYEFADLRARWDLLQAHLITHDAIEGGRNQLEDAVRHYSAGFLTLADERVGSHGSAAIAREFVRFRDLFTILPEDIRNQWYSILHDQWSNPEGDEQSTSLMARLEELY